MVPLPTDTLREKLADVKVPEGEPDLLKDDSMLWRYIKARNGNVDEAEKMIRKSIEWRCTYKPYAIDCQCCHQKPGLHSLRQVGFDEAGRPVLYSSFTQAATSKNTAAEAIAHLTYVLENAIRSMPEGVSQWVLVFDCSGMSTSACHPRLAYDCAQILSNHYPERLGKAFCALPGTAFQAAWKAIRGFLPVNTVSKVKIINSKTKLRSHFEELFSPDMVDWMMAEIELNKKKNITPGQRSFWLPPSAGAHDPRGSPEYTAKWLSHHPSGHQPHPNIVDNLERGLSSPATLPASADAADGLTNSSEEETELDDEKASDFLKQLPSEYQIPTDAGPLS